MEREFQSIYITGEGDREYSPAFKAEDPFLTDTFSNMNFQSLASLNQEKALLASLDNPYCSSSMPDYGDFQVSIRGKQETDHQNLMSYDFMASEPKLKMPKHESSPEPYSFIVPKSSVPVPNAFYSSSFSQLPDLRSLEQVQDNDLAVAESSSRKRGKSPSDQSLTTDPYFLESILNFEFASYFAATENPSPPTRNLQTEVARKRRCTLSEKNRCLQKLLPWDTKMDQATTYEEAHKYIRFLQAQISVLQSMPRDAGTNFSTGNPNGIDFYGGLGRLNRQQLLQVLVNSPVAQTILYSRGFCVYSMEQLLSLKKLAEKKLLMFNPSMLH